MNVRVPVIGRTGSSIRHFGAWAYDRPGEGLFNGSGRYVPLCGQRRVDGHWREVTGADHRRLCRRCEALATAMVSHG